jgi:hypothetical protein
MKHSSADFATHVLGLLKNSGPTGPTGPTPGNAFNSKGKVGTSDAQEVGPVDFEWSHLMQASGPKKSREKQSVTRPVTSGTSGTTTLQQGPDEPEAGGSPAEWHDIFSRAGTAELPRLAAAGSVE